MGFFSLEQKTKYSSKKVPRVLLGLEPPSVSHGSLANTACQGKETSPAGKIQCPRKATVCSVFTQDSPECARAPAMTLVSPKRDTSSMDSESRNQALLQHRQCDWTSLEGACGLCPVIPPPSCNACLTQLVSVNSLFKGLNSADNPASNKSLLLQCK